MHEYATAMTNSGMVFDLTILLIFFAVSGICMLYAKRKHAIAFRNRRSEQRHLYETTSRLKDDEEAENQWF